MISTGMVGIDDMLGGGGSMLQIAGKKIAFIDMIDRERIQRSAPTRDAAENEWRARINKLCKENITDVRLVLESLVEFITQFSC